MTVNIEWTYAFQDGEYPEWTLVVVTEGMKGLLRTAAAQNLSIDPESLRIQAHTRQQIKKSTGKASVAAAELRISVEAEENDQPELQGNETTVTFLDETFNMDTPATFGGIVPTVVQPDPEGCEYRGVPGFRCVLPRGHMGDEHQVAPLQPRRGGPKWGDRS